MKIWIIALAAVAVVLLVSIVALVEILPREEPPVACPDGSTASTLKECPCPTECCTSESDYQDKACGTGFECIESECVAERQDDKRPCIYTCCSGESWFKEKSCASGFECIGRECVPIDAPLLSCGYDCCEAGSGYEEKNCSTGHECVDNNCVEIVPEKLPCPYSCCTSSDVNYVAKNCSSGKNCVSHRCVYGGGPPGPPGPDPLIDCSFECCPDGDGTYKAKSCPSGQSCESYLCVKPDCPTECCESGSDYKEKTCSGTLICESSVCVKPDCPYACCESDDAVYKEKTCVSGDCILHQCVDKVECEDDITCVVAAMYICARADSNPTILGEQYIANITGRSEDKEYCNYYVKLTYSETRPGDVGKDMTCEVPYTAMSITQEFVEAVTRGEYGFCTGPLAG